MNCLVLILTLIFRQFNSLPSLEFCLLHNHGMIWHMEWCPSGCYDEEDSNGLRRMGLLAVACSDGNIIIYSIHFPDKLQERYNLLYK